MCLVPLLASRLAELWIFWWCFIYLFIFSLLVLSCSLVVAWLTLCFRGVFGFMGFIRIPKKWKKNKNHSDDSWSLNNSWTSEMFCRICWCCWFLIVSFLKKKKKSLKMINCCLNSSSSLEFYTRTKMVMIFILQK